MELPNPLCGTPGCDRPAAPTTLFARGEVGHFCCRSCASGHDQHDAGCSESGAPTVHQRTVPPQVHLPASLRMLLCRRGCQRRVTLGLRLNGDLVDTCCRACASSSSPSPGINDHDEDCTGCGLPAAMGWGGLQGRVNAEEGTAIGVVLGGMCGDVLGWRVVGRAEEDIVRRYPRGLTEFRLKRDGLAYYTDCTEMTLALLCCLLDERSLSPENATRWYCCMFHRERGYHGTAVALIEGLRTGRFSYNESGRAQFPDGSHGNRGATRIAPVGFVYRHCNSITMRAQAVAILSTARIMCEGGDLSGDIGPKEFVHKLKALAQTDDMAERLDSILQGLEKFELEGPSTSLCKSVRASISEAIQIRADDAVACSLWAMCTNWEQPREAVIRAACFGGDSAAIASMTGALAGAKHGWKWIPIGWFNTLENGMLGRDHAIIYAMDCTKLATPTEIPVPAEE
eukprot:jgi/Tetstr1/461844/TSEL_006923.t1